MIKKKYKFNHYDGCWLNNKSIIQLQQRFKSEADNVYTKQIIKIALSGNDEKRLQTFGKIRIYPYRTNAFKVCESEMLSKYKWLILMIMQVKIKQNII